VTNCELIPDPLQNGILVAEVLKNRPDCSLNFSVTYRRVPVQDVTRRHMQVGNILPHRGADVRTCINTFLPTPYLSGCFITSAKFTSLDHKKPRFCPPPPPPHTHTHMLIILLDINKNYACGHINPLNPELNPICYLLALLGAHHFLHVSRIRVKLLTFRRLMSYIYGAPILDVSRSHTTTQHSR